MPAARFYHSIAGTDWRKSGDQSSFQLTPNEGVAAEDEARPFRFLVFAFLWSALLAPVISIGGVADSDRVVRFDISRQRADQALIAFAEQADVTFIFPVAKARKVTTNEVKGEFTPEEAIQKLLDGTDLQSSFQTDGALTVSAKSGASEQGETVKKRGLLAGLIAAVLGSPTSDASPDQEMETRSGIQLEEIFVTARKRSERLQDVPISIFAISSDEIDRRALVNAEDYLRGIPGANQVSSGYGQSIVIRGIETSPDFQNFWSGTTVATYFGETPTTNSAGLSTGTNVDLKLVDIERVEVLRGPQGTAFGNSAMGGAVRTIPVSPKLEDFEGKLTGGFSSTSGTGGDNYNVQAVGNFPLIKDRLAIRATAYQYQDSGYYDNRAGSDAAFQAAVVAPFGAEDFAFDEKEVGDYYVIGGRVAALLQATDDLKFTLSYIAQEIERDGFPLASSGTYEQTLLGVAPEHIRRGQKGGSFDTDIDILNAVVEYDLGSADLLATYSHTKSGTIDSSSFTSFGLGWPLSYVADNDHRANVAELRLATRFGGAWEFLAGVYYEDLKDELFQDYLWHGDPTTNFFTPGERFIGVYPDRRSLQQKAAFGEASWELVQGLTLTGGVRVYEYDRTFRLDAEGAFYGPDGIHVLEDTNASGENLRASLSYKLGDSLLYAGWAEGFRLGQLQPGLAPGACDLDGDGFVDGTDITIESTREVNSDDVNSYELGGKFAMLDGRFRIDSALFRMDWSGMPVTVRPESDSCLLGYLANAGEARSEGIEIQASLQVTDAFRVDAGASWIRARLTEDAPALNAPEGNRLPGAPEVNANLSLQYEFEIGGYNAFVRADAIYIGPFYADLAESPILRSDDYVKVDTSARVELRNLTLDLFVDNLTNEDAFTFRGTFGFGEFAGYRLRPRTIGLRLGYTF